MNTDSDDSVNSLRRGRRKPAHHHRPQRALCSFEDLHMCCTSRDLAGGCTVASEHGGWVMGRRTEVKAVSEHLLQNGDRRFRFTGG